MCNGYSEPAVRKHCINQSLGCGPKSRLQMFNPLSSHDFRHGPADRTVTANQPSLSCKKFANVDMLV